MKTWVKWMLVTVVVLLAVAAAILVPTLRWYRGFSERLEVVVATRRAYS